MGYIKHALRLIAALALCTSAAPAQALPRHCAPPSFPWSRSRQQDKAGFYDQPAGLCEDYPREARTQARLDRDFRILRLTRARLLRVGIAWESIETAPGQYEWSFWDRLVATAARERVTLLPYVCYTPAWAAVSQDDYWKQPPTDPERFSAFMRVIASRYRGRVHSWELWNEPDNLDFWLGDVTAYVRLVQAGARGVRLADPSDAVVIGGLADGDSRFSRTLLRQPWLGETVSAVNFHGYNETWNRKSLEDYARESADLSHVLAGGHPQPDLWMAEFGYSDLPPPGGGRGGEGPVVYDYQHTASYQAAALFKSHVVALSTGRLTLTAWYRINDLPATTGVIGDAENRHLGVVDVQGRPKPALGALRLYNTLFGRPTRCLDASLRAPRRAGPHSELHVFEQRGGRIIVVAWLPSPAPGEVPVTRTGVSDPRAEEVSLVLPAGTRRFLETYDLTGHRIATHTKLVGRLLSHVILTGSRPFIATVTPLRDAAAHL